MQELDEVKVETRLTSAIRLVDNKKMYDEKCKQILSDKMILAWIMKESVEEYADVTVEDIAKYYIEGNPNVGSTEVVTGKTIYGLPTEEIGLTAGKIFYDIRYRAVAPKQDTVVELIINVEAQNKYNPGYPLVKRAVFYDGNMIAGQYGIEFDKMDYNKVKKVYSIWICRHVPKKLSNSITCYEINERNIVGKVTEKKENYDLLSVVMIYLGKAGDEQDSNVLNLLNRLFSEDVGNEEKLAMLVEEYGIERTDKLKREVMEMCNLSQGVEDRGIAIGINQGIKQSRIEMAKQLLEKNMTIDFILDVTKLPREAVEAL